jgi:hypothetical protein
MGKAHAAEVRATPEREPNFIFVDDILSAVGRDDKIYFGGRWHVVYPHLAVNEEAGLVHASSIAAIRMTFLSCDTSDFELSRLQR